MISEWQPIETAPKDATLLLGYGPHKYREWYIDTIQFYMGKWTITWMDGFDAPTHWMPLPAPPNEQGAPVTTPPKD